MRAVVDTNVLVSALMSAGGAPAQVMSSIASGQLRPVVCADILAELQAVLPRPRLHLRADRVAELLSLIELTAEWVLVPRYTGIPPLPDPDDWPFIGAAQAAACPLITGNLKHFPPGLGVRVMTAREWVDSIGAV
ncbi:putative toxin-antitoxin system toxin component, PIN family [Aquabacterium sp. OR-4]|uniref:putative toxin-antitoxin system toxin component, PIN family n=1 Tax=Aquabacterium sp. OR-4 TaxID=2978127 RepID=UPI0021B3C340|nr:putative toxin-antitoxin system toxin component, PIN family [Aquabacterium sp. OR-4]MDT7838344.1 putative toxin-antitoxin system toxin component, PIN family [Aquabacterium sp. OR-4]